jgi:L-malate glycosyltransferase
MKLLLLSDANSIHTQRWVLSLLNEGINLRLFSLFKPNAEIKKIYSDNNVKIDTMNFENKVWNIRKPNISKIQYIIALPKLKNIIKSFSPEFVHAHYASSYGLLAYLSGFRPFILSVWGSDIYLSPKKNIIYKSLIKRVIKSADHVCSTSLAMKKIISKDFNRHDCDLIPFGININKFIPKKVKNNFFNVGTIKSIESYNGIDCLINAADIIINKMNYSNIKFIIVGKGSLLDEMKEKSRKLKLEKNIIFKGHIIHEKTIDYFQKLSVFIAVSTRESFGVSILEAGACGIPSITSNVGGLPEVNKDQLTGFIIPPNNPEILANKIINLYENEALRKKMGNNARVRVVNQFNWSNNIKQMLNIYKNFQVKKL